MSNFAVVGIRPFETNERVFLFETLEEAMEFRDWAFDSRTLVTSRILNVEEPPSHWKEEL